MSGLPHAYGDMPHEVSRQCLYSALAGSQALSLFGRVPFYLVCLL